MNENDNKKIWDSVLVEIELSVSMANFTTWFKDTHIIKQEDGIVHLSVPNAFAKDWLLNKFHKTILKSLRDLNGAVRNIEYIVAKDGSDEKGPEQFKRVTISPVSELPLAECYINKDDNLNPRYVFETFVVGPFNELAHAAAQAIIKKPGDSYNPFFIYGSTGHGKTHLIQAIGNYLKRQNTHKKVYYITSEKYALDYINSVQANKINQFKEKYRKYDTLIMDDIQFFSNKEKTQEELFHLFNILYDDGKQIIFSSDKHPNFIQNLEDRLKSRFNAGMIVEIPPPDHESRASILRTKFIQRNFSISEEIIDYLASSIEGNIRDLEGIINSIICQAQLKNKELGLIDIKNLIKNNIKPKKNTSIKEIIKVIAEFYNIEEKNFFEKTRKKEIVKPRQVLMYVLREDFNISYPSIGQKLGGRDHTTVIHSYDKIKNELKTNNSLIQELSQIRALIV